jgi:hypothetical protein
MAAPTYTWEFNSDLFGDRVPKVVTLKATSGIFTKIGTLMSMASGKVLPSTDGNTSGVIGLALEVIDVAATEDDPVKVAILAPGMIIKGTAVTTAAAMSGFQSKAYDLDVDGRLDPSDTTGGGLNIWRTEDAGLTVYAMIGAGACIG